MQVRTAVVVTGLGAVTPLGHDLAATWAGLLSGCSGIAPLTRFDAAASGLYCHIAGECRDFAATPERTGLSARELRRFDRFVALGLAAALDAVRDAGLEVTDANRARIGVLGGSGMGGLPLVEQSAAAAARSGVARTHPAGRFEAVRAVEQDQNLPALRCRVAEVVIEHFCQRPATAVYSLPAAAPAAPQSAAK